MEDDWLPSFIRESYVKKSIRRLAQPKIESFLHSYKEEYHKIMNPIEQIELLKVCVKESEKAFMEKIKNNPYPYFIDEILSKNISKYELNRRFNGMSISSSQFSSIFKRAEELGYTVSHILYNPTHQEEPGIVLPVINNKVEDANTSLIEEKDFFAQEANPFTSWIIERKEVWHCFMKTLEKNISENHRADSSCNIRYFSNNHVNISFEQLIGLLTKGFRPVSTIYLSC